MRRRRLGVIGTFVWDVIYGRDPRPNPVEEWGGVTYSLEALDAALDDTWEIVPLIKVGGDLITRARDFMHDLGRVAPDTALIEVPYQNNRVVLRYISSERRSEVLSGHIPGWSWLGLKPLLHDLDALYVNLISGFELDLETARLLRQNFAAPIYCDLHSLLLSVQPGGLRAPRLLPNAMEWCRCFDMVQVNEAELALMTDDPIAFASAFMASGTHGLFVTQGVRGVVYFASAGFENLGSLRRDPALSGVPGTVRTARVPATPARDSSGDPTGCGDVWGATYFARLLSGDSFAVALQAAMNAAARNVEHRGATGLSRFLRGGIATR